MKPANSRPAAGAATGQPVGVHSPMDEFENQLRTLTLQELLARKGQLDSELDALVDRRSLLKTLAERLELTPEAVRITGAIFEVEKEIKEREKP